MQALSLAGRLVPAPFALILFALAGTAAHADHSTAHQLETVTVTAVNPSTQNSIADARTEVARTAGGATVVEGADLRDQRGGTLTDALSQAAGVFAQSRFGSQEMRLSIRGSGLQRTFHLRGINVLQDGVPLNLADGSGDFQSIDTLAASHIEVFRGANALQYGGATLGGSINFVTDTGYTAGNELRLEGGSFGYQRAHASSGVVKDNLDGFASLGYYAADGFREHAEQREFRLTSNVGLRLANGIENRTFLTITRSDSELPGNLTQAQLQADPTQANAGNRESANDNRRDTKLIRLANKSVARVSENTTTEVAVYTAMKRLDHPIFQVIQQDNFDYGVSLRLINTAALAGRSNRVVLGINPSYGLTKGNNFINTPGSRSIGARTDRVRQAASNFVAYGENQFGLTERLTLVAGAQGFAAKRNNQDQFVPSGQTSSSYDRSYLGFAPKIGGLYALREDVQVFGNVSGSFEPPSFGEGPQVIAGGPLKAQRGVTAEIGTRSKSKQLSWDLSLYRAQLRNELLSTQVPVGGNQTSGVTVNADRTIHQGIEAAVSITPLPWATVRLNGLYNDFTLDGDASFGDNTLPGIPEFLIRTEWRADFPLAGQSQFIALTTESADDTVIDYANTFSAEGYTIFGIKAGGTLAGQLSWFAEGRNLADEKYAASTGVIRSANDNDQPQFLPGDGVSVYAGLTWTP